MDRMMFDIYFQSLHSPVLKNVTLSLQRDLEEREGFMTMSEHEQDEGKQIILDHMSG
jgi:hypothetical protein